MCTRGREVSGLQLWAGENTSHVEELFPRLGEVCHYVANMGKSDGNALTEYDVSSYPIRTAIQYLGRSHRQNIYSSASGLVIKILLSGLPNALANGCLI